MATFIGPAAAYETVTGPLLIDKTLTAGNTYLIDSMVDVPAGRTLTVEAGAVVKFRQACCVSRGLRVYGRILVQGTAVSPVVFTGAGDINAGEIIPGEPMGGYEIRASLLAEPGSGSELRHVEFRYSVVDIGRANVAMDTVRFRHQSAPFRGDLSPQGTFNAITFGSEVTNRAYIVTRLAAEAGDRMRDLGVPYFFWYSTGTTLDVPGGASLTVDPGVEVRLASMTVSGSLLANGLPQQQIVFAGSVDTRYGDVNPSTVLGGEFSGIRFNATSQAEFQSVVFAQTSSGSTLFDIDGASPTFKDLKLDLADRTILTNGYQVVNVQGEGNPIFSCVDFDGGNAYVAVRNRNLAQPITFVDTYWQHPAGPTPLATPQPNRIMIDGAVNVTPFRTDRNQACIASIPSSRLLDIDGNGSVEVTKDFVLLGRYLAGLRGNDLIDGLIGADATRRTAQQLEAYLAFAVERDTR